MKAHGATEFRHSFESILFSASQGAVNETFNIEERFFQLLWEQSEGNPGMATELWLSAVTSVYNNHIKIGLPKDSELGELQVLTQNMLFIFAATFRHEALSIREASAATNLPLGTVRQAFKMGLEQGMIVPNENNRYKIAVKWTHFLIKHLKRKNYLYGTN